MIIDLMKKREKRQLSGMEVAQLAMKQVLSMRGVVSAECKVVQYSKEDCCWWVTFLVNYTFNLTIKFLEQH